MLRQHSGSIIGANKINKGEFIDNAFAHGSTSAMTISLYGKSEVEKKLRPMTAPVGKDGEPITQTQNWLKKYDKLQMVPEEGGDTLDAKDTRLPDFKPPKGLALPPRTMQEELR